MNVLFIEDDQNKINQIKDLLTNYRPNDIVCIRNSFNSGLKMILSSDIHCILLDMSMPTFDITPIEKGGSFRMYGGKDILRQMQRRKLEIPVIIVTQFDHFGPLEDRKSLSVLSAELRESFPEMYMGTVYYNTAINNWKEELLKKISQIDERRIGGST